MPRYKASPNATDANGPLSVTMRQRVRNSDQNRDEKILLLALLDHVNVNKDWNPSTRQGQCYPGKETLCFETGYKDRQLLNAQYSLMQRGLISVEHRSFVKPTTGDKTKTNLYTTNCLAIDTLPDARPRKAPATTADVPAPNGTEHPQPAPMPPATTADTHPQPLRMAPATTADKLTRELVSRTSVFEPLQESTPPKPPKPDNQPHPSQVKDRFFESESLAPVRPQPVPVPFTESKRNVCHRCKEQAPLPNSGMCGDCTADVRANWA